MTNEEKKLKTIVKGNPDPNKWSKYLKLIVKILLLAIAAITGDSVSINDLIF